MCIIFHISFSTDIAVIEINQSTFDQGALFVKDFAYTVTIPSEVLRVVNYAGTVGSS